MSDVPVHVSPEAFELLEQVRSERGGEIGDLLDEAVFSHFATDHLKGLPSPKTFEELVALIDQALDDPRPRIEATPEYFDTLRQRINDRVSKRK